MRELVDQLLVSVGYCYGYLGHVYATSIDATIVYGSVLKQLLLRWCWPGTRLTQCGGEVDEFATAIHRCILGC